MQGETLQSGPIRESRLSGRTADRVLRMDDQKNLRGDLAEDIAGIVANPEEDARFYFEELPALFRAKYDAAMAALGKVASEMKQKIQNERLEHEQAYPAILRRYLRELEASLHGWLQGNGPQEARHFAGLAKETCRSLQAADQEALLKDSDYRRQEQLLEKVVNAIGKQFEKKGKSFAADVYRQVALCLNEKYAQIRSFREKPYEVKLRDGEIIERPVSFARNDGAWIGDSWIVVSPPEKTENFFPAEELLFPVGFVHPYQTPGWLTFGPESMATQTASSVLSNVLFQRLLSGLPNVKVAIFDSGRSDITDYEHDLSRDLPSDPEEHEKLLVKFMDFGEFTACMETWLKKQPENYEKSRNNKAGNKRLFQLYAVLVLPDNPTEHETETYREWMTWWMRQASRGVGLFVVSTDRVFETIRENGENDGLVRLTLDNSGDGAVFREGGDLRKVKKTTLNPSWASNAEDWNMGRQVLQKLIRPPQKELPGAISVRFADEENGEAFNLRYTSTKANTVFIHGQQGSGKSVALLFFILRAAKKYSPEELAFYVFDFKNTFALLRNLKHVECLTLSTNEQIMLGVLRDLEMRRQERQKCFREMETKYCKPCRDLDDSNQFREEYADDNLPPLPRILVVVDECKNMLLAKLREIGELLENELLSKCRAAGIHFLFATTEDICGEVGRGKFDATVELSQPTPGRFIATLSEGESKRTLIMPVIAKDEIENELRTIDEINRKHQGSGEGGQPLFFDEDKDWGVAIADYMPFADDLRMLSDASAEEELLFATGIDTQHLRRLLSVTFHRGRCGQGLSIFGRWNSPCFRGGMELFLRTLELAARMGRIRVDVLDSGKRWNGKTDGCPERFRIWRDAKDFLEVKRGWIRTANGQGALPSVLVAFDAEDTLQGETSRARRSTVQTEMSTEDSPSSSPPPDASGPPLADLDARLGDILNEPRSAKLSPNEVDRLFQDEAFLKATSAHGAFLVVVTEKPVAFRDSVVTPDSFGRFLVYATTREFPDLYNAPAGNMGYYAESPGEPPQFFLPFAQEGISEAIEKAAMPQKGHRTP